MLKPRSELVSVRSPPIAASAPPLNVTAPTVGRLVWEAMLTEPPPKVVPPLYVLVAPRTRAPWLTTVLELTNTLEGLLTVNWPVPNFRGANSTTAP